MQEISVQILGGEIPWRRDRLPTPVFLGFPGGSHGKESALNVGDMGSIPRLGRANPVFLPGESPWTEEPGRLQSIGHKKSGTTEPLSTVLGLSLLLFQGASIF